MATKTNSIIAAQRAKKRNPEKTYSIYRVGVAWMFTSETEEEAQRYYRVKIQEWTVIA